jgi:tetratricopeptide (TPR) repeat protein
MTVSSKNIAESLIKAAEKFLAQGKLHQAKYSYYQALQINPDSVDVYQKLGNILSELGENQEASVCYQKVTELEPEFWEAYHCLGDALRKTQQWQQAAVAYRRAIELNPDFFWSYHHLGTVLTELQQWQKASLCYQKATELEPEFWESYHSLGDALLQMQQWQEATLAYRRALELNSHFFWSHYNLGIVLSEQGKWSEAIAAYQSSLKLQPDSTKSYLKLADALKRRGELDLQTALTYYRQAIEQYPDKIELYLKALEIKPDEVELYLHLGNVLVKQNQLEQAINYYQKGLKYQSNDSQISIYGNLYFALGKALAQQRNIERAIDCYRKAIELEPNNFWHYDGLGNVLTGIYDLEEAIAVYQKGIELNPDCEPLRHKLNIALDLKSRWERVITYCQQVLEIDRSSISGKAQKTPLKMLMIFPFPPYPPQKGGAAIRMFEQIKYFGSRHHLTVVSFIFAESDYQIEEQLKPYCDRAFMVKLGVPMTPYQENVQQQLYNLKTWNMWKILQQLSQIDFDVVFFDFIVSTIYYPLFASHFTVLNEHNIESKLLRRCAQADSANLIPDLVKEVPAAKPFLNAASQSKLLEEYENQTWHKFPLRSVVSDDDKKELNIRCSVAKTIVVKNGIDTRTITAVDNSNNNKLLYMGTMNYYPNIDAVLYFVEEIFPKIKQQDESISVCVAGHEPPSIIQELATPESQIEIIADPQNMSEVAQECSISIVPLRLGSGTRIKILHSMAMGLPVISTSLGCEGLEVIDGVHLLIRDNPEEFAEAVLQVNSDRQLWEKLRENGRKLVAEKYDWQNIFSQYEQEILSYFPTET